jgi:NAD(P)-dependent dehydrogenase (short-subunit alcohol dehydrogenase family)
VDDAIRASGGSATLMPYDLARIDDLGKLRGAVMDKFGRLDILIGNAAMLGTLTPVTHMTPREWDRVMTVNVHANLALLRALEPLLRASDAGRAVFTSSGLARHPLAYWGAYCASKAALDMMVKVYAAEVAEIAPNLRVNLVDPGMVDTAMLREAFPGGYHGPMPVGKPDDVVPAFMTLALSSCTRHGEIFSVKNL